MRSHQAPIASRINQLRTNGAAATGHYWAPYVLPVVILWAIVYYYRYPSRLAVDCVSVREKAKKLVVSAATELRDVAGPKFGRLLGEAYNEVACPKSQLRRGLSFWLHVVVTQYAIVVAIGVLFLASIAVQSLMSP